MTERAFRADAREAKGLYDGSITRVVRVVEPQPETHIGYEGQKTTWSVWDDGWEFMRQAMDGIFYAQPGLKMECPFGVVGDRLWVRETCKLFGVVGTRNTPATRPVQYKAGSAWAYPPATERFSPVDTKWRPPTKMPRWASRTLLDVTDVHVVQAQNITEDDAAMLGLIRTTRFGTAAFGITGWVMDDFLNDYTCVLRQLIGPDIWDGNKWLWVGTVEKVKEE